MFVPVTICNVPDGATVAVLALNAKQSSLNFTDDQVLYLMKYFAPPNHPTDCTCQECIDEFIGWKEYPYQGGVLSFDFNYVEDAPVVIRVRGRGICPFESHGIIGEHGLRIVVVPIEDVLIGADENEL